MSLRDIAAFLNKPISYVYAIFKQLKDPKIPLKPKVKELVLTLNHHLDTQ